MWQSIICSSLLAGSHNKSAKCHCMTRRSSLLFAMRSCKFSIAAGDRKTKVIALRCLVFLRKNDAATQRSSREMFSEHAIAIAFVSPKNERLLDSIAQESTEDHQLSPVKLAVSLVWRARNYPETNDNAKLCYYNKNCKLARVDQSTILDCLRSTAFSIGEDELCFSPSEIGSKSTRSGACVAWFLAHHPVECTKMMGRWESEAWLVCARKQVMEFCKGMPKSALRHEFYHELPSFSSSSASASPMAAAPASHFNCSLSLSSSFSNQH